MPTKNKEVLRIRAIDLRSAWQFIHLSGESKKDFHKRFEEWKENGSQGDIPERRTGGKYKSPPKDFKALRAERKLRWKKLMGRS